jgi:hypothetical protein
MNRFIIRAHYFPGVARLGTVEASDKYDALNVAEDMGLLDDPDAVDFTASLAAPTDRTLSKDHGE